MALDQSQIQYINDLAKWLDQVEDLLIPGMVLDAQWSANFSNESGSVGSNPITDPEIAEISNFDNVDLTYNDIKEMRYIIGFFVNGVKDRLANYAKLKSLV